MGKLYAISDIHISHPLNYKAFDEFFASPTAETSAASKLYSSRDGLILAGDITEKVSDLRHCFETVTKIFGTVWWVPGNHELYTLPPRAGSTLVDDGSDESIDKYLRGTAKYDALVEVARSFGVMTPEDEYVAFSLDSPTGSTSTVSTDAMANLSINHSAQSNSGSTDPGDTEIKTPLARPDLGRRPSSNISNTLPVPAPLTASSSPSSSRYLVCPIFTLYDYSFRPSNISRSGALEWARATGVEATDEVLLHPDPHPTRDDWCWTLTDKFAAKLTAAKATGLPLVLVNHWPLREDLVHIPLVPRFTLWCGTKRTHDWHVRFNAAVVVTGHLHVRRTDWKDGVRFEEVSMGYPRQWEGLRKLGRTIGDLVREILPGADATVPLDRRSETIWRRNG